MREGERAECINVPSLMVLFAKGLTSLILKMVSTNYYTIVQYHSLLSDSNVNPFTDISTTSNSSFEDQLLGFTVKTSNHHVTVT